MAASYDAVTRLPYRPELTPVMMPSQVHSIQGLAVRYNTPRNRPCLMAYVKFRREEDSDKEPWYMLHQVPQGALVAFLNAVPSLINQLTHWVRAEVEAPYISTDLHGYIPPNFIVPHPGHPDWKEFVVRDPRTWPDDAPLAKNLSYIVTAPQQHFEVYLDSEVIRSIFANLTVSELQKLNLRPPDSNGKFSGRRL